MSKADEDKIELQVYMSDNLEFKDYAKVGTLQLYDLRFILMEPIILGTEKAKKLVEVMKSGKLKITIEKT